jgi:hypothetical protein
MKPSTNAERAAAVAALLEHEDIECDGVSVAGAHGDVVVIRCRSVDSDRLAAVSKRIKALGFHWVTVDLGSIASST